MLIKRQQYIFIPLICLLGILVVAALIPTLVAVFVVVLAVILSAYQRFLQANRPLGFYICWLVAILLGIFIGLYRPPGFSYPLVFSVTQLYDGGLPFGLYLNTGKLLAGYVIVFFLLAPRINDSVYIRSPLHQYILAVGLGLFVPVAAFFLLDLQLHFKALNYILAFAVVNLLGTCVAEEAFMRLLLQAQLRGFVARVTGSRYLQELIPLLIATLVFVLTHMGRDLPTMLVFSVAGLIYGVVYSLTKNLWACVLVHFTVNFVHFSFLTYPLA